MNSSWYWRAGSTVLGVLIALYILIPSFFNFNAVREVSKSTGVSVPWYFRVFPEKQVKLGLDLQGGIHLVLGVDIAKAVTDNLNIQATDLREDMARKEYPLKEVKVIKEENKLHVVLDDTNAEKLLNDTLYSEIRRYVRQRYSYFHLQPDSKGYGFEMTYKKEELKYVKRNALEQSLQVLRNRVDEFGVNEPSISAQGDDRILIQLPGVKDPARAKELIGKTAQLSFMIVDDETEILSKLLEANKKLPEGLEIDYERVQAGGDRPFIKGEDRKQIETFLEGKIPDTHVVYLESSVNKETLNKFYRTYILKSQIYVTGDMLDDARTEIDPQWNRPVVGLRFNAKGGDKFKQVTTDFVGKRLAIVLDQNIMSAPSIREPIPNGRAVISFGESLDYTDLSREAQDLAIVLRAGSLKAPVEILEDRTIGPTLGADSIRVGKMSLMFGGIAVIIFMVIYYQKAGLMADLALILNGLFILATLVMFQATLTLPGIAGLILTAGMAVDANVIIFERVREELRTGKDPHSAVASGYGRAFWTVFDANITTAIAGIVLMQYGTGPIKGFAVTLLIGIVFSFVTAVYVTRFIFEWVLEKKDPEILSI